MYCVVVLGGGKLCRCLRLKLLFFRILFAVGGEMVMLFYSCAIPLSKTARAAHVSLDLHVSLD